MKFFTSSKLFGKQRRAPTSNRELLARPKNGMKGGSMLSTRKRKRAKSQLETRWKTSSNPIRYSPFSTTAKRMAQQPPGLPSSGRTIIQLTNGVLYT